MLDLMQLPVALVKLLIALVKLLIALVNGVEQRLLLALKSLQCFAVLRLQSAGGIAQRPLDQVGLQLFPVG